MSFTLRIEIDNDAFVEDPHAEVSRLLRVAAGKVDEGNRTGILLDINGNLVGEFTMELAEDEEDEPVTVDTIVARIEDYISTSGLWDPHNSGYVFCVWDGHVNDNPVFKRQADYHPIIKVTWEGKRARLLPGDRDAIIAGLRATAGFRWDQAADAREVLLASGIDPDGKR